jgi:hypothetical protein
MIATEFNEYHKSRHTTAICHIIIYHINPLKHTGYYINHQLNVNSIISFHNIFVINCVHVPKHDLCNGDTVRFLRCGNWIYKQHLDKFQASNRVVTQKNMAMGPEKSGTKNDCAGEGQNRITSPNHASKVQES